MLNHSFDSLLGKIKKKGVLIYNSSQQIEDQWKLAMMTMWLLSLAAGHQ
jgi:hypothetical protein